MTLIKRFAHLLTVLSVILSLVFPNFAFASTSTLSWATKTDMTTARYGLAVAASGSKVYAVGGTNGGGMSNKNEIYDPSNNTWSTGANLPANRYDPGFIDGGNSKLYMIGGAINGTAYATNYQYDPSNDTWTTKTSMSTTRDALGVAQSGGKIYAIGGAYSPSGTYTYVRNTVEQYDPSNDTWTTKASLSTPRGGLFAVTASNGKIYAIGGFSSDDPGLGGFTAYSTVEEYNPSSNTWATKTSMPTARYHMSGFATSDGKIYVVGGTDTSGTVYSTVEEYDTTTDTWRTVDSMTTARYDFGMALASNGKAYAVGGYTGGVNPYSAKNEEATPLAILGWATKTDLTTARYGLAVAASGSKVYAMGGSNGGGMSSKNEIYDPSTDTWSTGTNIPANRYDPGLIDGGNSKLYMIGGAINGTAYATNYQYDPSTDTWTTKTSMSTTRDAMGIALSGSKIYVIGGAYSPSGTYTYVRNTVEAYDPSTDTWSTKTSMPTSRGGLVAVTDSSTGKIYAIGGFSSDDPSLGGFQAYSTVEQYDPSNDTWTTKASMPVALYHMSAVYANNGMIYVIGGTNTSGTIYKSVFEYDPSNNQWKRVEDMPTARYDLGAASPSNHKIYVIGGYDGTNPYSAKNEEATLQ